MTSDTDSSPDPIAPDPISPDTARGRPRDEERTAAILDATHAVIHSKGWNDLTMGDIAKAAGCGLATIYRRWDTKEALVAAAMTDRPLPRIDETGDARTDLEALICALATEMAQMGPSIIGFIAATQSDDTLHEAFSEGVLSVARPRFAALLDQILGEQSIHTELVVDAICGSLIMRAGILENLGSPDVWTAEVMALVDRVAD